jgi:hypothetical protein
MRLESDFRFIINQFSLSWVPYRVSKLAALAQVLITFSSPLAQSALLSNLSTLSTLSNLSSSPEHAWSSHKSLWFMIPPCEFHITFKVVLLQVDVVDLHYVCRHKGGAEDHERMRTKDTVYWWPVSWTQKAWVHNLLTTSRGSGRLETKASQRRSPSL